VLNKQNRKHSSLKLGFLTKCYHESFVRLHRCLELVRFSKCYDSNRKIAWSLDNHPVPVCIWVTVYMHAVVSIEEASAGKKPQKGPLLGGSPAAVYFLQTLSFMSLWECLLSVASTPRVLCLTFRENTRLVRWGRIHIKPAVMC